MHYYWQILYVTVFYNKQSFISFCVENTYVYVDFWYITFYEAEFWKKSKKKTPRMLFRISVQMQLKYITFRKIFVVP